MQERLSRNKTLITMLEHHKSAGKIIAAICAAPAKVFKVQTISVVFRIIMSNLSCCVCQAHGLITAHEPATCYPSFQEEIENKSKIDDPVVVAGK